MVRKMIAEVTIEDPNNLTVVCAALIEHGLDVELGDCGDKDLDVIVQLDARTLSELDDGDFRNWVTGIVKQVGASVNAAGPATERDPGWVIELSRRLI